MLKYLLYLLIVAIILPVILFWKNDIPLQVLKEKYATAPSQFAEVMGIKVHYRDEGNKDSGLPLVLIHGTGASLNTWEGCVALMKDSFRIITMDLPAYGLTGPNPRRDYSQDFYLQFMHEFLTKINVEKCHIGGNSLGGAIAWNYAYTFPENVEKLILINAAGYPVVSESKPIAFTLAEIPVLRSILNYVTPRFLAEKSVKNVYDDPKKVDKVLIDRYFDLFLRPGNRQAFIDRMEFGEYPDYDQKISAIKAPTLIIWGKKDRLIPLENAFRFQKDLPENAMVLIDNTGHVPMEEVPDRTVAAMLDFLKL